MFLGPYPEMKVVLLTHAAIRPTRGTVLMQELRELLCFDLVKVDRRNFK